MLTVSSSNFSWGNYQTFWQHTAWESVSAYIYNVIQITENFIFLIIQSKMNHIYCATQASLKCHTLHKMAPVLPVNTTLTFLSMSNVCSKWFFFGSSMTAGHGLPPVTARIGVWLDGTGQAGMYVTVLLCQSRQIWHLNYILRDMAGLGWAGFDSTGFFGSC